MHVIDACRRREWAVEGWDTAAVPLYDSSSLFCLDSPVSGLRNNAQRRHSGEDGTGATGISILPKPSRAATCNGGRYSDCRLITRASASLWTTKLQRPEPELLQSVCRLQYRQSRKSCALVPLTKIWRSHTSTEHDALQKLTYYSAFP